MPYAPSSFNYSVADPFAGQFGQLATQGMDFARWAADKGFTLADLARQDRNTQLAVENAFRQEQANRGYGLERDRFGLEKTQADRAYQLQQEQLGLTKAQQQLQNQIAAQSATTEDWLKKRQAFWRPMSEINAQFSSPMWQEINARRNAASNSSSNPMYGRYGDVYSGTAVLGLPPAPKRNIYGD